MGSTLGPNGSTVLLEDELGKPHTTKDGVTVAKSINLSDPVQHLGMSVVRQASMKTADEAGDGTTTSVVVAHELISVASEELKKDKTLNIYELCAHLSLEMNEAVEYIKRKAIDADKELSLIHI